MTIKEATEGLLIMAKYSGRGDGQHLGGAEHDIIYGPLALDTPISAEDRAALDQLGWHTDEGAGCWAHFT